MSTTHESSLDPSKIPDFGHLAPLFLALHVAGGQVGLPIIITTFLLSKNVHRHPTLINFCVTWVIYSVSHSILLYSGDNYDTSGSICFAQSALIHGAPPMCAVATLVIVVQIWWAFQESHFRFRTSRWPHATRTFISLALPYIAFLMFTLISTLLQLKNPGLLMANGLYCTYLGNPFRRWGVPTFCTVMLTFIILFEVIIAIRYFRAWTQITTVFPLADRRTSPALVLRILIFSVYSVITLSAGVFFLSDNLHTWPFFVQAALPLIACIIFGTQKDLLFTWFFCVGKRESSTHTSSELSIPTFRHPNSSLDESSCSTNTVALRMID
ncbi:hypothetical protein BDQ17DRAFT_1395871 [Cyathus striatus]|nr:hypothetical protein BDQ17DRAFT_1395871 [Cyathus striatus]